MNTHIVFPAIFTLFLAVTALAQEPPAPVTDEKALQQLMDIKSVLNDRISLEASTQSEILRRVETSIQSGLSGSSGIGAQNNMAQEQSFRNWTPSSTDLANMVQSGLQTGSLADQIKYYNQKFHVPTGDQITPGNAESSLADYAVFSAVSTNTALSIADKSFDNALQIVQQIDFLYKQLDQQQTLKQSSDFHSAVLLKIAALQTDLIRLQSQQLKMLGVFQQEGNSKRLFASQFVQDIPP